MKDLAFQSLPGLILPLIAPCHDCVTMAKPSGHLHLLFPFSVLSTCIRIRQDVGHSAQSGWQCLRLASPVRCSGANSPCSQEHCLLAQNYYSVRFYCLCSVTDADRANMDFYGHIYTAYILLWQCKLASLLQQICHHQTFESLSQKFTKINK